jgi:hypothetical protein
MKRPWQACRHVVKGQQVWGGLAEVKGWQGAPDWMRTVGLALEALSGPGRAGLVAGMMPNRLCRPEAVMVRMGDAWREPACPVRRSLHVP